MKATGIVRRVDDLGRIVIPKGIRRTLKIREGDPFTYLHAINTKRPNHLSLFHFYTILPVHLQHIRRRRSSVGIIQNRTGTILRTIHHERKLRLLQLRNTIHLAGGIRFQTLPTAL